MLTWFRLWVQCSVALAWLIPPFIRFLDIQPWSLDLVHTFASLASNGKHLHMFFAADSYLHVFVFWTSERFEITLTCLGNYESRLVFGIADPYRDMFVSWTSKHDCLDHIWIFGLWVQQMSSYSILWRQCSMQSRPQASMLQALSSAI